MVSLILFIILIGMLGFFFWFYTKFDRAIKLLEKSIEKIGTPALYDPITDLPYRAKFFQTLKKEISLAQKKSENIVLFVMGVDNFKVINETLGYEVGDGLLKLIAKRLKKISNHKKNALARLPGDHFTYLLTGSFTEKQIREIANQILTLLKDPFWVEEHEIHTSLSIGISLYPIDGLTSEVLFQNASIAARQAKHQGKNVFCFYSEELNTQLAANHKLMNELRKAIERGELEVYYQPKIEVKTKRIVSAEALIRWNHPKLGWVSPSQFIPLAEQSGLILPISDFLLNQVCKHTVTWHKAGFMPFSIAINLTAAQFKTEDIAKNIANALWESKLDPHSLELEITESLMMENVEKSLLMLRVLKSMGIQISIDDFGTGYSSLSQLRKFPVDSLKIDQSFIKNMQNHPDDATMITTIVAMAKQLNLKIIAEGVETEEQFEFLKKEGVDFIQGYFFSPPVPANQFEILLQKNYHR